MFSDAKRFRCFEESSSKKIVGSCKRVAILVSDASSGPVAVYVPGGDDKYPSFWIRDAVMQCRSGFAEAGTMAVMLRIILHYQNGSECRKLANGLRIDPWSVADHLNLSGLGNEEFQRAYLPGAVFYPGSYSPGDNQGDGRYGLRPADDNIYEVVELVRLLWPIRLKRKRPSVC